MSWTVTDRGEQVGEAGDGAVVIPSFTPTANSFLTIEVAVVGGSVSSISGHGTWSRIESNTGTNTTFDLWGCRVGGSPSASAVTITRTYTFLMSAHCTEHVSTAGINGTTVVDAVGTPDFVDVYTSSADEEITGALSAFDLSSNLAFGFGSIRGPYSDGRWSAGAGFTELVEWAVGGPFSAVTFYQDGEDTTPSVIQALTASQAGAVFVEIKEAAGAGADVTGSGTPSFPLATIAGTGTITTPSSEPDIFVVGGAVALALPSGLGMTGSGTVGLLGDGAPSFPLPQMSGVGLAYSTLSGSGTPSFPLTTMSGSGQVITPGMVTGTGALMMPSVVMYGLDTPPWGNGPFEEEIDWFMYRRRKIRRWKQAKKRK